MSKITIKESASLLDAPKSASVADSIDCISLGTAVPPCEVKDMNQDFLQKLLVAQKIYGKKFKINSAFRSLVWEKSKGRSGRSSHCEGLAVDIGVVDHKERLLTIVSLICAGFGRIGIAKRFIHVDADSHKPISMWLYHPDNNNEFF